MLIYLSTRPSHRIDQPMDEDLDELIVEMYDPAPMDDTAWDIHTSIEESIT